MVPTGTRAKRSRSAIFEFWVQEGRNEEVTARLVADMAELSSLAPSRGWAVIVQDPKHSDYVRAVVQTSNSARLIPEVDSLGFWTYEYIHMASQNYGASSWFLPVAEEPYMVAVPQVTIPVTPLDVGTAPEKISEARDQFAPDWEYDKSQVRSRRREWFFFRRQGCQWPYERIAEEFGRRRYDWELERQRLHWDKDLEFFDPDPPELEPTQIGRDVRTIANRVGLHLDRARR